MSDELVSVVIPSFNRAATISRAIDSVLNQTYSNIEIIVVDDCSTDNTAEIVAAYTDPRVRYLRNSTNSRACISRNKGIAAAKGDCIALHDSDDAWRPEKLQKQLEALNTTHSDVVSCRIERHGYPKKYNRFWPVGKVLPGIKTQSDLVWSSLVSTQTILAKRKVFNDFLFDPALPRLQDYDWVIRASKKYQFVLLDDVLVDVYLQDDSITNSGANKLLEAYDHIIAEVIPTSGASSRSKARMIKTAGNVAVSAGVNPLPYYRMSLRTCWNPVAFLKLVYYSIFRVGKTG